MTHRGAEQHQKANIHEYSKLTFLQKVEEKLLQSIPDSKIIDSNDLIATGCGRWIAITHFLVYATTLFFLLISGTNSEYNRKFLAISEPKSSEAVCETVPVAVTGVYQADINASWSTRQTFLSDKPIFELILTGSSVTRTEYTRVMQKFSSEVKTAGANMASYDVISAQIAWALFQSQNNDSNMRLRTYARLNKIFQGMSSYYPTTLSSAKGVCGANIPFPTYDDFGMKLTAKFPRYASSLAPLGQPTFPTSFPSPAAQLTENYNFCPDQIQVEKHVFNFGFSDWEHTVEIDIRSIITAYAVNFGIIDFSMLTCSSSKTPLEIDQVGFIDVRSCIDSDAPDMETIICASMAGEKNVGCFYAGKGNGLMYPILTTTNIGDDSKVSACTCPQDIKDAYCNDGSRSQLALVFSQTGSIIDILTMIWKLQKIMANDAVNGKNKVRSLISGLAYTARLAQSRSTLWKDGYSAFNGKTFEQYSDEFITTLGEGMSIMSFEMGYNGGSADLNSEGLKLSDFSTSKANPSKFKGMNRNNYVVMCSDSLYRRSALSVMSQAPPIEVVQPYFSCHPTMTNAIITASGIAAGNAALLTSVFLALAISLLVYYTNNISRSIKIIPPNRKALMADKSQSDISNRLHNLETLVQTLQGQLWVQNQGVRESQDNNYQRRSHLPSQEQMKQQQQHHESVQPTYIPNDDFHAAYPTSPMPYPSVVFDENPLHRFSSSNRLVMGAYENATSAPSHMAPISRTCKAAPFVGILECRERGANSTSQTRNQKEARY